MNKLYALIAVLFLGTGSLQAQIDIADARNMSIGSTVTVKGIVTNGPELSIIRYMQDASGAIAVYPGNGSVGNFPNDVTRGDEVQVTGQLKEFNGLLEIDPVSAYTVISNNNPSPAPLIGTPNDINESNESKLMTINNVTFADAGGVFSVGNFSIMVDGEVSEIYVRSNHPLIGTLIPLAKVNLTGICSEFNGLYQLLPRDPNDLQIADDFYITENHSQSDITTDGFTISWKTNEPGSSNLRYGTDPNMLTDINMGGSTADHSITLTDLDPAEFYFVEVYSDNGSSTTTSTTKLFSTGSNSTGEVQVYFNFDINANFSNGSNPTALTSAAMEAAIIERINAATTSIDVSMYNNNRESIVQALSNAYNNGIQVRYVADDETANLALSNPQPPFPVIKGNNGSPLMHNKFYIFDADSEDDSWVISGSTNMTSQNIAEDYNNMVFIQDQALAKAYRIEFQEMWGSAGQDPGIFNVKFGESKKDNTPHLFNINGMLVESYFSPSDRTTVNIVNAIKTANTDVEFALLTFTNNELGNAILEAHNDGVQVRGIIDNVNDQGSEFTYLDDNGVNVTPDNTTDQTHHKYALVDASDPTSDPMVITGSHNWSASAEVRNDENTLIIHDADIANIYLQEFEARWCEATGGTNCTFVSNQEVNRIEGFEAILFPNPAVDYSNIQMELDNSKTVQISLWDIHGRLLQSSILRNVIGTANHQLRLEGLPSGSYLVDFKVADEHTVKMLQVK